MSIPSCSSQSPRPPQPTAARRIHIAQPKWSSGPPQPLAQPQPAPAPAAAAAAARASSRSRSRSRPAGYLNTIQASNISVRIRQLYQRMQELESEVETQRTRIHVLENQLAIHVLEDLQFTLRCEV